MGHKKKTEESFRKVQKHGNIVPLVVNYGDPSTWVGTLQEQGLDPSQRTCFLLSNLTRVYNKDDHLVLISTLNALPKGSMVATEFWGETLWGHPARDIEPMKGTLYPFEMLLDEPADLFDEKLWSTKRETLQSLNHENRCKIHPPATHNMVFGIHTKL